MPPARHPILIGTVLAAAALHGCDVKPAPPLASRITCQCKVISLKSSPGVIVAFGAMPNDGHTGRVYSWTLDSCDVVGLAILASPKAGTTLPTAATITVTAYGRAGRDQDLPATVSKFTVSVPVLLRGTDLALIDPSKTQGLTVHSGELAVLAEAASFELRIDGIVEGEELTPLVLVRDSD